MKKFTLAVVLVLSALLLQYCKKSDSDSATTVNSTQYTFSSYINDTLWVPANYNAQVAYTAATKNKVFTCTAAYNGQQVNLSVTQPNASSVGNGFPLGTFNVSSAGYVGATYARAPTSTGTNYVQQGTLKSGYVTVSAVDSVKMTITGTFTFNTVAYTYDAGGINITSITVNNVSSGAFNNLPYVYKKN